MVKTLSTALVFGIALMGQSYAQDVFSGDQKAKPKYPKAQVAAADQAKKERHVEKAIAVQSDKTEAAPKKASVTKPELAQNARHDASPGSARKSSGSTSELTTKTASSGSETSAVKGSKEQNAKHGVTPESEAAQVKTASAQNAKHDAVPAPAKKAAALANESAVKPATAGAHREHATASAPAKVAPALAAKTEGPAEVTLATKSEVAVAKTAKLAGATQTHSASVNKAASVEILTDKAGTRAKAPKVETGTAKLAVVVSPAEGPKHELATHVSKKASVAETKPAALAAPRAVPVVMASTKDSEEEEAPSAKSSPSKAFVRAPTIKKTLATVKAPESRVASPQSLKGAITAKTTSAQNSVAETGPIALPANAHFDTAFTKLADGFDFPVGKPDAQGYYKARGFRSHGHLGEDWDGVRGGDTDLGDPIYSIGDGLVVFARDCHMGWGNVVIVRHSYRESGTVKTVDALYGHLNSMLVHRGQAVARGQKIATMGTAHGLYDAHLHLEVRKNLEIGMSRAAFARDSSNYYDPTQFILAHRRLPAGGGTYRVAMNTFTRDAHIKWDKARNFSHAHTGGGSSESAAALKRAVAAQH